MTVRTLKADAKPPRFAAAAALCVVAAAWLLGSLGAVQLSAPATAWAKSLIVAPVIEELFFRGVVQSSLRERAGFRGRPWLAIAVTAVLFAAAHLVAAPAGHAALVLLPAVVLGWVYERTRSIGICIVLHSAANAVWLTFWST